MTITDNFNYISNLSLIGAIILLIGLFTPAGFVIHNDILLLVMLPGFFFGFGSDWTSYFPSVLPQFLAFINAIFLFLIMLICCIIIISTSIKFKHGKIDFQHYRKISLNNAFILTIDAIFWILLYMVSFYLRGVNFWGTFIPGFGIIGPFIITILILIEFFINVDKVAQENREYKYYLPLSSFGGFLYVVITWPLFASTVSAGTVSSLFITSYGLIVALIIFIGIFSIYTNLRKGYIILIIALIMSLFYMPLLSTIIPARKEYQKKQDQS